MLYEVYSRMNRMRIVPVSVDADGTLLIANRNVTVVHTDTGVYTITLNKMFQQKMFAFACCQADDVARHIPQVPSASLTHQVCVVKTFNYADAAEDAPFDVFLVGSDGRYPVFGGTPLPIVCGLIEPRLWMFYYSGSSDSLSQGRNEGTMVKTGTGRYTLTFKTPTPLVPHAIAVTSSTTRHVEIEDPTRTTLKLEVSNAATGAAADGDVLVLVLASMSKGTYQRAEHKLMSRLPWLFLNPLEYDGADPGAMVRGIPYASGTRGGAGDYTFTFPHSYTLARYGFPIGGATTALLSAMNTRTIGGFDVDADADTIFQILDIGQRRGR